MSEGIKIDLDYWIKKVEILSQNLSASQELNHSLEAENINTRKCLAEYLADKHRVKKIERLYRISAYLGNNSCIAQWLSDKFLYKNNDKAFTTDWQDFCKELEVKDKKL